MVLCLIFKKFKLIYELIEVFQFCMDIFWFLYIDNFDDLMVLIFDSSFNFIEFEKYNFDFIIIYIFSYFV